MISKKNAIIDLAKRLGIKQEDTIPVGDGINDISMFEYAGYSIFIGDKVKEYTDISFNTIEEAIEYLLAR